MKEITMRSMPHKEYIENLRKEIADDGLFKAVEKRCELVDEECKYMRYVQHRYIQEQLSEIQELVKLREGEADV